MATTKKPTKRDKIVNHFAAVLDSTGSIAPLKDMVVDKFNVQLKGWKEDAASSGQETTLTLVLLGNGGSGHPGRRDQSRILYGKVPIAEVKPLTLAEYWLSAGGTALLDSTDLAIQALASGKHGKNTSFLVLTVTDGEENASVKFGADRRQDFANLLAEKMATDVWTFTYLLPKGSKASFCRWYGVPEGNVEEWETTARGVEDYTSSVGSASLSYFGARARGATATKNFFSPDLSKLKTATVKRTLEDVSSSFKRLQVVAEMGIREFYESFGETYEIGRGFYQLSKPEDVQGYKRIVVEDKVSRKLYSGADARSLIGMPTTGVTNVKPLDLGKYLIYIQSNSVNRKLVRGTTLLYLKQNIPV